MKNAVSSASTIVCVLVDCYFLVCFVRFKLVQMGPWDHGPMGGCVGLSGQSVGSVRQASGRAGGRPDRADMRIGQVVVFYPIRVIFFQYICNISTIYPQYIAYLYICN